MIKKVYSFVYLISHFYLCWLCVGAYLISICWSNLTACWCIFYLMLHICKNPEIIKYWQSCCEIANNNLHSCLCSEMHPKLSSGCTNYSIYVHRISKLKESKTIQTFVHVESAPTNNSSDDRPGKNLWSGNHPFL